MLQGGYWVPSRQSSWISCDHEIPDTDIHAPTLLSGTQALGLGGLSESNAEQDSLAASINRATYDAALRLVPAPARERYERRGRRLHFAPDRRAR